jgi:hypothetical protein
VFPDIRVAMGGDLFGAKGVPFIDVDNGGTAIGYAETVANTVEGLKNVDTVISGHVEAYTSPASLTDFSFTEPFATNFIQLLSDEMSAR